MFNNAQSCQGLSWENKGRGGKNWGERTWYICMICRYTCISICFDDFISEIFIIVLSDKIIYMYVYIYSLNIWRNLILENSKLIFK